MFSPSFRQQILDRLGELLPLLGECAAAMQDALPSLTEEEGWALRYLYACSPLSDLLNYPPETFLDYARHGASLYHALPSCRELPEGLFGQYVLHHRVNNEEVVPCRAFFHRLLRDVVAGKSGEEAVIAVNYWCASHVSYCSTDGRTASPLAVFRSAQGRCGEESTFVVHALRSIGIPARQVYAPAWSHCDDNHAWVEAFCGGSWHFLGACEPEEQLDRGWFVGAASRAMLVRSPVFGIHTGEGPEAGASGMVRYLNHLPRYANTRELRVLVRDAGGNPAAGANICFQVLNYAHDSTIARMQAGAQGTASLITGLGSLHIFASFQGLYGECDASAEDTACEIQLQELPEPESRKVVLTPPAESTGRERPLTPEQKRLGQTRLEESKSLREQKTAAFQTPAEGWPEALQPLLLASRGNREELLCFLRDSSTAALLPDKTALLQSLSEKDRTDSRAEVLLAHLAHAVPFSGTVPRPVYERAILCPRIDMEPLSAWRAELLALLPGSERERMQQDPRRLWKDLQARIRALPHLEFPELVTLPHACLKGGLGSGRSLRLLFVAICRTLGIPACLRAEDGVPLYYQGGTFHPVCPSPSARLLLHGNGEDWALLRNWSLSRLEHGRYRPLFPEERWDAGRLELTLPAGHYRFITCNRLPDGTLWADCHSFCLAGGERVECSMRLQKPTTEQILQQIPLADSPFLSRAVRPAGTGKPTAWIWLEPGREPTEHILNELLEQQAAVAPYQGQLTLITGGKEAASSPLLQRVLDCFSQVESLLDPENAAMAPLARRMYRDPDTFPFLLVCDRELQGVYAVSGYHVGSVDLLLQILSLLSQ